MDDEQWTRAKRILDDLLDEAPDDPAAWLEDRCEDAALRADVEDLFRAHQDGTLSAKDHASGWLADGPGDLPSPEADAEPSLTGQRIGAYRLVEEIGVGGMSVVYRAERVAGDYEETVAMKLLQRRLHSGDAEQRFRAERQVLASLDHPHIAQLRDGGVTEGGRPYLVMEHVDGVPLTDYADANDLGLEARLDLLGQVFEAVQAAHEQLVVHRDLKPSNVLVTETEDGPRVKLLDFGIAKLLGDAVPVTAPQTETGHHLMTPAYAAPEQVRSSDVSTRTDVYQLGVLAYELLAGTRPFDLSDKSLTEIEHIVLEERPPPPSEQATGGGAQLRGDLDTIVQKALRKEPERRYRSVEALAADLKRYRREAPIEARTATLGYRTRKFMRRNAVGMGVAGAFLALIALAGALLVQQRNRAQREAQTAEQVTEYLAQLFEANQLSTSQGDSLSVRSLLDRGQRRIEDLSDQPAVQARLLRVMGQVRTSLGEYRQAERLHRRALDRHQSLHSGPHAQTAKTLSGLGNVLEERGEYRASISRLRRALNMHRASPESDPQMEATMMGELSESLRREGALDSAEAVQRSALTLSRREPEADSLDVATALMKLGIVLRHQGNLDRAEALHRQALQLRRSRLPPDHLDRITSLQNLASVLSQRDKYEQAETLYRRVIATYRENGVEKHPGVAQSLSGLGVTLRKQGYFGRAEEAYRQALSIERSHVEAPHPDLALYLNNLGVTLKKQGRLEEAATVHQRALSMRRTLFDKGHSATIGSLNNLATLRFSQDRVDQAARRMRMVVSQLRTRHGDDHPRTAVARNNLAVILSRKEQHERAIPLYRAAVPTYENAFGSGHPRLVKLKVRLAESLLDLNRYAAADSLLTATHRTVKAVDAADSSAVARIHDQLANLHEARGNSEVAAQYRQGRHPKSASDSSE